MIQLGSLVLLPAPLSTLSPVAVMLVIPVWLYPTLFPYTTLFRSCPDETNSNRLGNVFEVENRCFVGPNTLRSEEHTSELQSLRQLVCRPLLQKKKARFAR